MFTSELRIKLHLPINWKRTTVRYDKKFWEKLMTPKSS